MIMNRTVMCIFCSIVLLGSFIACTDMESSDRHQAREMTFNAWSDIPVRTTFDESDCSVRWADGDKISVFDKATLSNNEFRNTSGAGTSAVFQGLAPLSDYYLAVYPYQQDAFLEDDGETLQLSIPACQSAVAGSFGREACLSVAATSSGDLYFRNVGALLSFEFNTSHKISQVRVSSPGVTLAGGVSILADPSPRFSIEGGFSPSECVTVSGNMQSGSRYYAVVFPGSYPSLRVDFIDDEGGVATYTNDTPLTVGRNGNVFLGSFNIPESKWGSTEADGYEIVKSGCSDWSGTYLIVATDASGWSYAADGVVSSKWLGKKEVKVEDGKIDRTVETSACEVTVEKSGKGYSLRFANGNYLGTSNKNDGIKTSTSASSEDDFCWDFSYSNGLVSITVPKYNRTLRLNGDFRTYTGTTGAQATLYRAGGGAGIPPLEMSEISCESSTTFLIFTWPEVKGAAQYGVVFDDGEEHVISSCTYVANGLEEGRQYTVRIRAISGGPEYQDSPYRSFTARTKTTEPADDVSGMGWYELPGIVDADRNGICDTDKSLYYAYHICGGGEKDAHGNAIRNYTVCYSAAHHCPVWVAAPRHSLFSGSSKRSDAYQPDPNIPSAIQYHSKSTGGGCNKGHMLGSKERTSSSSANRQVFYYSNIAPQDAASFNTGGGAWNNLEDFVDGLVVKDTLYEVVGCFFDTFEDAYGNVSEPKVISFGGRNDVSKPTMFYYALLRTKKGTTGKDVTECQADELQCVAFVISHTMEKGHKPRAGDMISISDLEALTGFKYFTNVPNAPKDTFKASDWGL